ncbi:hypothetical protein SKAU_G00108290 [Synaphobranchus kaupii]|uniref:Interferon-related developmental regulator 2 n=1 Tax=Synaphobranchus kaupii TaxID=118154 RepID=A0A9Q1J830_SYNKA|nr:hypothetical protein SKAU_G00108290 [Synaphobranchus kaupii]
MPKNKKGKRGSNKGSLRQEVLQLSAKAALQCKGAGGKNGVKGDLERVMTTWPVMFSVTTASASESASVLDEGPPVEPVDEQTAQEETEDKLKQCIDNLMDKSAKTRWLPWRASGRPSPPGSSYGRVAERSRRLRRVCVPCCVCSWAGGDEGEEGFRTLRPVLSSILSDGCASIAARQSCATALGMCCYVSAAEDAEDLVKSMSHLESVFTSSYPNREGTLPTPKQGAPGLHCAALQAWALLVTLCPASRLRTLLDIHLPKLQACLECSDVNYRIAVGATIALLFELGRDIDRDFQYEDCDALCEILKGLATDGNKHRAKNDRRKQRSIFREVLHYIENEDFTEEKIRFGVEGIYIDSWMRRRIYDAFKEVLESGVRHHLQYNQLLRDIFELGPPLILDASVKASRISRFEKHLYNSAAFKARTKLRNKVRDKRADVM